MTNRDTASFFAFINKQNEAIVAREAKENAGVGVDLTRLQLEQARREKWGTLRARKHSGKRPKDAVRNLWGYTDLS